LACLYIGDWFFLFWIAFSGYYLLHAKRHRLHVTEDFVEQWGIFHHQKIDLPAVTVAVWRPTIWNPKRIDLQTSDAKVAVSFQELSTAETKELILFFRRRLPDAVQKNWERFWEFNWKCFDEREPIPPEEIAAANRSWRRLMIWSLGIAWVLLAIGDIFAWRYTEDVKWLWQPVGAVVALAIVGFVFARLGNKRQATQGRLLKTQQTPKISRTAIICIALGIIYPFTIMALRLFPHNSAEELILTIVPMLLLFVPTFWELRNDEKQRQAWNRETAKQAAELYLKKL
jgi:membrane protein YdbS with pleckstrin-like domain